MNQSNAQTKFKIAKGELVNIVSAGDIPIYLAEDRYVTANQVTVLRSGEVLVKLAGVQFIARRDQLKPPQESYKEVPEFLFKSWDSDEREKSNSSRSSNNRRNLGRVSYVHSGRPTGNGRVIRSVNNW